MTLREGIHRRHAQGGQAYEVHLDGLSNYAPITITYDTQVDGSYTAPATLAEPDGVTNADQTAFFRPDASGTYDIDVSDPARTGTYSVSVDAVATDTTDSTSTATTATVGGSVSGSLTVPGQNDWVSVTLNAGQAYAITLDGLGGAPTLEVGMPEYMDRGYEGVTTPEPVSGSTTHEVAFFRPEATKAYYIDVGDGGNIGNYTVGVQAVATDVTNDASTTGSIAIGGSTEGTFTTVGQHAT